MAIDVDSFKVGYFCSTIFEQVISADIEFSKLIDGSFEFISGVKIS